MATDRKYFYMRLKEDFFDSEAMVLLESLPDGLIYQNILLKMYCRSLKNEGRLMFNNVIPYNSDMIAKITRHQVGTVEKALQIFQQMGLIDILDNGAIYMMDIQQYIGKSSTEADRQREYQKRISEEKLKISCKKSNEKCKKSNKKSTPYIDIDTELKIELDTELDTDTEQKEKNAANAAAVKAVIEKFNEICSDLPSVQKMTDARKKAIQARIKEDGYEQVIAVFTAVRESDFLCGKVNEWHATFDWIMKPSNFAKIIEGNYANKTKQEKQKKVSVTGIVINEEFGDYIDEEGVARNAYGAEIF